MSRLVSFSDRRWMGGLVAITAFGLAGCAGNAPPGTATPGGGTPSSSDTQTLIATLSDSSNAEKLRVAGDGLASRRSAMSDLFPETQQLITEGSAAGDQIVQKFQGQAVAEDELSLSILAYVLEQINYAQGIPQLVAFVNSNISGIVPDATQAVTHALRVLSAQNGIATDSVGPPKDSAYYLADEMEQTAAALAQPNPAAKTIGRDKAPDAMSCSREFFLIDPSTLAHIKDANGNDLKVGGQVINPAADASFATTPAAQRLQSDVQAQGGRYDTQVTGGGSTVFVNQPSKRFNCAGFAFRDFNDSKPWVADPQEMLASLTSSGALRELGTLETAQQGDFVFFVAQEKPGEDPRQKPAAHVAVIDVPDHVTFNHTLINADGPSGLFRAELNAQWYTRYSSTRRFFRWTNGSPPKVSPVVDRSVTNSCFGDDANGDGWPDSPTCGPNQLCIDPELGGVGGTTGFRVYLLPIGSRGQLEVLPAGSENQQLPLCNFEGGGTDCTITATPVPVSDVFATPDAAVLSLCPRITNQHESFAGPAADLDGVDRFLSSEVAGILSGCGM